MSLDGLRRRVARLEREAAEYLRDEDRKKLATLQARAARLGLVLHVLADGGFLLTKWNLCRECRDLAAVEAALTRMEPPSGSS